MKKSLIFLLLVFLFPIMSAQNITVNYSNQVVVGEEFSFNISLVDFLPDVYDVKIDIIANGERVARILEDGTWKSTRYYVYEIISPGEEKEITLKVLEYIGIANVTIKIRNSAKKVEVFAGYIIEIIAAQTQPQPENQTNESEVNQSSDSEPGENDEEANEQTDFQNLSTSTPLDNQTNYDESPVAEQGVIRLNPKIIKSEENNKILEKNNYALYGFFVFCVLLAFLFLIKKKKY